MLQKKKLGLLAVMLLSAALFWCFSTIALAATYELDRIDLYDYYDDDDRIRIDEDDIDDEMEEDVEWRRVRVVPRATKGDIRITGEVSEDKNGYYVTLDEGDTATLRISVCDSSGNKKKTYTLELTRGDKDEYFSSIEFTGDDYTKKFDKLSATNKFSIPMSETELRLKVKLNNRDYSVECNDSESKNNTWDISISKNGASTVYLTLYNDRNKKLQEYKFEITRSSKVSSGSSSNLDLLDKLTVTGSNDETYELFPDFDEDTEEYYVCFPSNVRKATISPSFGDDTKSIKINNKTVRDDGDSDDLTVSNSGSTYTMRITDDDGDTHDYKITLIRSSVSSGKTASLERLRIKRGTTKKESSMTEIDPTPAFDEYTEKYKLTAGGESAYFSFRPQLGDSDSIALLSDGNTVTLLEDGVYSSAVELESKATAKIRVYSPNCENYKEYTFDVQGKKLDKNAYLDDLVLYVDGVKTSISPSFSTKTFTYTANVGTNAKVFTITPTAEDDTSTITVMDDKVRSGRSSSEYSIGSNFTSVPVAVTAEDGSVNTYRLTLNRSNTASTNNGNTNTNTSNGNITVNQDLKVVLRIGSKTYLENGKSKQLAAAPYITSNRTQVPLRVIAESIGAGVNYNAAAKQIAINMGSEVLYMDIGKTIKGFDVAPEVKANTTFVPVRYVSEKLGCKCTYNNASKEVIITAK